MSEGFEAPCRFGGTCTDRILHDSCVKDERVKNNWMCWRDGILKRDDTPKEFKGARLNKGEGISVTGQGFKELSVVEGVLEVRPTRKGDEHWIGDTELGAVLGRFNGKRITLTVQEATEAVTA